MRMNSETTVAEFGRGCFYSQVRLIFEEPVT